MLQKLRFIEMDEEWANMGFEYKEHLNMLEGFKYEFERLYVIEHKDTHQKAVMVDCGNTHCSFVSDFDTYEKKYCVDFDEAILEIYSFLEKNNKAHLELHNGMHLHVEVLPGSLGSQPFRVSISDTEEVGKGTLLAEVTRTDENDRLRNGLKEVLPKALEALEKVEALEKSSVDVLIAEAQNNTKRNEKSIVTKELDR